MESIWWYIFDIMGTLAFAVSGVLVAVSKRMDLFGILVLAASTAIGGGIIRDLMLGHTPPIALQSSLYFFLIIAAMLGTTAMIRYFDANIRSKYTDCNLAPLRKPVTNPVVHHSAYIYLAGDTIGLASFAITGTLSGLYFNPDMWVLIITLGVITAVGGGVIRDVLAGKVPSVLVHDIYATAALLGSVTLYVLVIFDWPVDVAALISFFTTVSSRVVAIKAKLDMPHVKRKRRGQWL